MNVQEIPKIGSPWVHKSGRKYVVVLITNLATTDPERYPVSVVYSDQDGQFWSRPLSDWERSMSYDWSKPSAAELEAMRVAAFDRAIEAGRRA